MYLLSDYAEFNRGKDKKKRKSRANWRASATPISVGQKPMTAGVNAGLYNTKANILARSAPVYGLGAAMGGAAGGFIGHSLSMGNPRTALVGAGIGALGLTGYMASKHKKELETDRHSPFYDRGKATLNSLDLIIKDLKRKKAGKSTSPQQEAEMPRAGITRGRSNG